MRVSKVLRQEDLHESVFSEYLSNKLSVRARNVLSTLGVDDIESMLQLTREQLDNAWSCGEKTTAEIKSFQKSLHRLHISSKANEEQSTLSFANAPFEILEAVKAVLGVRANYVLNNMKVTTLKEFMLLEYDVMLKHRNCGRKTVREIQNIQRQLHDYAAKLAERRGVFDPTDLISAPCFLDISIKHHARQTADTAPADPDQPAVWLKRWILSLARSERQGRAFLLRKGMLGFAQMTLDMVSKEVGGISRERVRQMNKYVEKRAAAPPQQRRLRPLIKNAVDIVQQHGGMMSIKDLTLALLCKGEDSEHMRFAFGFLKFMAKLNEWKDAGLYLNKNDVVIYREHLTYLRHLAETLENTVQEIADERHSDRLWSIPIKSLKAALVSEGLGYYPTLASATLSDQALNSIFKASKCSIKIHGDRVYSTELWKLRFSGVVQMAETVLYQMGGPAYYSEVAKEAQKWRPDFPINKAHSILNRAKHALLWNPGTFVHQDNVVVPSSLIHDVEEWLLAVLDDEVPFVSLHGAYLRFNSPCKKAGLPSDIALYSCLRRSAHPELVYPRLPYVYRKQGFKERIPVSLALETFLLEAGGPVSQDEFHNYVFNRLFLKDYQFAQHIQFITNVIRTADWGYIHRDNFEFDEFSLQTVAHYTEQLLAKEGHCSVDKVYYDKRVTCFAAGIDGPLMLYSILQVFMPDVFSLSGYPRIAIRGKKEKNERQTIRTLVLEFVRDARAPCTYETLEKLFVKKLGYKEQQIYSVVREPNVCLYHPSCVIHFDSLGWTQAKQCELEYQASQSYSEAKKAGRHFGRVSHLLEMGTLPDLSMGLHWSRVLIADLLKKSNQFLILGNSLEVYLPRVNESQVRTLQDLVALLLSREWGGAANFSAFENTLVKSHIVKKHLTESMLSPCDKVVIKKGEIILKKLLENA